MYLQVGQPSLPGPLPDKELLRQTATDSCDLSGWVLGCYVDAESTPPTPLLQNELPVCQLGSLAAQLCSGRTFKIVGD